MNVYIINSQTGIEGVATSNVQAMRIIVNSKNKWKELNAKIKKRYVFPTHFNTIFAFDVYTEFGKIVIVDYTINKVPANTLLWDWTK